MFGWKHVNFLTCIGENPLVIQIYGVFIILPVATLNPLPAVRVFYFFYLRVADDFPGSFYNSSNECCVFYVLVPFDSLPLTYPTCVRITLLGINARPSVEQAQR